MIFTQIWEVVKSVVLSLGPASIPKRTPEKANINDHPPTEILSYTLTPTPCKGLHLRDPKVA